MRELQKALSDSHTYLFEERERLLTLQAENDELKLQVLPAAASTPYRADGDVYWLEGGAQQPCWELLGAGSRLWWPSPAPS